MTLHIAQRQEGFGLCVGDHLQSNGVWVLLHALRILSTAGQLELLNTIGTLWWGRQTVSGGHSDIPKGGGTPIHGSGLETLGVDRPSKWLGHALVLERSSTDEAKEVAFGSIEPCRIGTALCGDIIQRIARTRRLGEEPHLRGCFSAVRWAWQCRQAHWNYLRNHPRSTMPSHLWLFLQPSNHRVLSHQKKHVAIFSIVFQSLTHTPPRLRPLGVRCGQKGPSPLHHPSLWPG